MAEQQTFGEHGLRIARELFAALQQIQFAQLVREANTAGFTAVQRLAAAEGIKLATPTHVTTPRSATRTIG